MSYRVNKEGEIICDTLEEAMALQAKMLGRKDHGRKNEDGKDEHGEVNESRFKEFMSYMKGNQQALLQFLFEHHHPKSDESIRRELGIGSNLELSGVMAGLSKNAKKAGFAANELIVKEIRNMGDERVAEYRLAEGFRAVMEKMKAK